MVKFTREVLTLYKVEITGPRAETDYDQLSVVHRRLPDQDGLPRLQTIVWLFDAQGNMQRYERDDIGQRDERPRAALHRIAKLNFYRVFVEELGFPSAPWGVLHGVRPTKIVHRWLRAGFTPAQASARLQSVYDCSREKAELIVPMAVRQLPFLAQGKKDMVSIYVGIPFCLTRCLSCSFPANILPGAKQSQHFTQTGRKTSRPRRPPWRAITGACRISTSAAARRPACQTLFLRTCWIGCIMLSMGPTASSLRWRRGGPTA